MEDLITNLSIIDRNVYVLSGSTDQVEHNPQLIAELMECAREKLPEHLVPVKIVVLDEMPLTPSGKIDYKVLEKMNLEYILLR